MKIYLLTNPYSTGDYDEYDSAVVVAPTPREAKRIHPGGSDLYPYNPQTGKFDLSSGGWPYDPTVVKAKYLGDATLTAKPGLVCASFNAG